jgi:DNA-binding GntR family transcriptional regulator
MLWNSVSIRVQQVMALRNQHQDDLAQIGKNHQAIVNAIASKDSETAVRLICEHIGTTGDTIVNGWEDE